MSAGNDRVLARALVSAMNDDVGQPPEEVLARVLGETERARPLPRLVALVVEPPIVMPARVVVGIRRSRLLMVAAALLIATTFVASGIAGAWVERLTAPSKPPDALERLQSLGTVRIAVSPDGVADSFEADVARALAERLGLPVSVVRGRDVGPDSLLRVVGRGAPDGPGMEPRPRRLHRERAVLRVAARGPGPGGFGSVIDRRHPGSADLRRRRGRWADVAHGWLRRPEPGPGIRTSASELDDPPRQRRRVPRRARGRHGPAVGHRDDVAG